MNLRPLLGGSDPRLVDTTLGTRDIGEIEGALALALALLPLGARIVR